MKTKDAYFQIVRGVCIIAVVWIHCAGVQGIGFNGSIYYVFQRNLINFPVAVFFTLSGYFTPVKWGGVQRILQEKTFKASDSICGMVFGIYGITSCISA